MHAENEGPGTIGDCLNSVGAGVQTARLFAGDRLPESLCGLGAVVTMGGPMNVYEEDRYAFLEEEAAFLRKATRAGIPILGICLGAQMLAKAFDAPVTKSPVKEVGWGEVQLMGEGLGDPLFHGLPKKLVVFQWHEDMFAVPHCGLLLATSAACPHQAFRYINAYGLQFHIEVTREMLSEWFDGSDQREEILEQFDEVRESFVAQAHKIYENFFCAG
jgi:GMP synthase-like glutamine amidotransferase